MYTAPPVQEEWLTAPARDSVDGYHCRSPLGDAGKLQTIHTLAGSKPSPQTWRKLGSTPRQGIDTLIVTAPRKIAACFPGDGDHQRTLTAFCGQGVLMTLTTSQKTVALRTVDLRISGVHPNGIAGGLAEQDGATLHSSTRALMSANADVQGFQPETDTFVEALARGWSLCLSHL